jgi:hypothetical protein
MTERTLGKKDIDTSARERYRLLVGKDDMNLSFEEALNLFLSFSERKNQFCV